MGSVYIKIYKINVFTKYFIYDIIKLFCILKQIN